MDKKRKRTESRKKIQTAVVELLKDHELHDLKVTTICKKAQINRSSFYDNYTDIYDLIDKLGEYLVSEYVRIQEDMEEPSFSNLLQHVKEHQELYRLFFKLNLQNGIADRFVNSKKEQGTNYYDKIFFRNGIVAVIDEWLKNDCLEPVDDLVKVIQTHLHSS